MKPRGVSPYLLLVLTTLFWSGNFVLARSVRLDVPPLGLSFWRWALAAALLLPFVWRTMVRDWPLVRANLGLVILLALLGVTGFNTFVYLGVQTTTASNAVLLQSVIPLLIILLSWLLLGVSITLAQGLGIALSLAGVLVIVTRGEPGRLLQLALVEGDLWVLAAVVSWALYSVFLRRLPAGLGGLTLLGYTVSIGVLAILPLYLGETLGGRTMTLEPVTIGSVLYVAVFPSLVAYLFWNRAVGEVGPNRAGQFIHLMPVFGSLLSVLLLGERLYAYHLAGILLVALGIYSATFWRHPSAAVGREET
ncbi:MAG TPA: DMT family transporter [Sedimenticola thiotaurini]|uniref:DMT family transporter n=1 Tax=Sedimenticola thiotaurini TaxID=1543721 RepID=A0A831RPX4_9GAMM|nr:DMT family transporter [Sedimenticola thiotaurini]